MAPNLDQRIETMYRGDRLGAWCFVAVLWIVILFVLAMVWQLVPDTDLRVVLSISAGAVLLFNTAAIRAMVKHYEADKEFIYTLDIRNLDIARAARAEATAAPKPAPLG